MEPLWYQCRETLEPEQEISRKKSVLIHLISLLEWAKGVAFIYLFNYSYNPAKSSIFHWITLIVALGNSLNLHIFEFRQFRPDLIAPINFGSRRTTWSLQVSAALILVNSMIPLSLLTKGAQTITKIVQMIENSVHAFTSFGNFMKDQRYLWLRQRWIICSQIMTLQYLI